MQIVFYLFVGCVLVQIAFWLFAFSPLANFKVNQLIPKHQPPLSVIICAYNEAHNLRLFLPKILEQIYPNFEVIVVNDRSTDDSTTVLNDFQKKYNHLKILHLTDYERTIRSKKFALTKGLEAANHEIVLLTDADCYPTSNQWIQKMAATIDAQKAIGIAYVPMDKRPTFLNLFIRYDKIYNAIQYLSFALLGIPYMGAGGNLIYKKSLFFKSKGFSNHKDLISGDDDLFISSVSNRNNTKVQLHPHSFIFL